MKLFWVFSLLTSVMCLDLHVYFGQNSKYNANPNPDQSTWEKSLGAYCKMDLGDTYLLSFLMQFPGTDSVYPQLNHAFHCSDTFASQGHAELLHCPDIATDIKYCQSVGKKVLLSLGGASGAYSFSSDDQAQAFALKIWNMFFEGSGELRPYDDAILDGLDFDIEAGGPLGYNVFIRRFKQLADQGKKEYFITAANQCPFPDAMCGPGIGTFLETEWVDSLNTQFYNNYCNVGTDNFNFDTWVNWAKTTSLNKHVKINLGVPAHITGASSGFVDVTTLKGVILDLYTKYPDQMGGVMFWDVGLSEIDNYGITIRDYLRQLTSPSPVPVPTSVPTQIPVPVPTSTIPLPTEVPSPSPLPTIISICPKIPDTWPSTGQSCNESSYCYQDNMFICKNGSWQVYLCENGFYCYQSGTDFGCIKVN